MKHPLAAKKSPFTVALVGADGAGKSSIARHLEANLPLPARYVYMGINLETSNLVLPTTRLWLEIKRALGRRPDIAGPPDPSRAKPRPKGVVRRAGAALKSSLRLVNLVAEEWFRQCVVWCYRLRGYVVLLDRHFFLDYHAHDIATGGVWKPLSRRIHGFLLRKLYPRPDLVICLDAPAEVLFARKGEGTLESLERRRQEYLALRDVVERYALVDATRPPDAVAREVTDIICAFDRNKTRKS